MIEHLFSGPVASARLWQHSISEEIRALRRFDPVAHQMVLPDTSQADFETVLNEWQEFCSLSSGEELIESLSGVHPQRMPVVLAELIESIGQSATLDHATRAWYVSLLHQIQSAVTRRPGHILRLLDLVADLTVFTGSSGGKIGYELRDKS